MANDERNPKPECRSDLSDTVAGFDIVSDFVIRNSSLHGLCALRAWRRFASNPAACPASEAPTPLGWQLRDAQIDGSRHLQLLHPLDVRVERVLEGIANLPRLVGLR